MLSYLVLSFSADLTCHDSNADDPNHIQYIYQDRGGRQECVSVVQVVQDTVLLTRDAAISGKLTHWSLVDMAMFYWLVMRLSVVS